MPTKKTGRSRGRPNKESAPFAERPQLTNKQWLALERELGGCSEEYLKDEWPSKTPAEIIAQAASVTRQMVDRWRKNPQYCHEYRRGLNWLLTEKLTRSLDRSDQIAGEPMAVDDPDSSKFEWVKYDPNLMDK